MIYSQVKYYVVAKNGFISNAAIIMDKVFKSVTSKICGRQPLKFEEIWSAYSTNFTWSTIEYFVPFIL